MDFLKAAINEKKRELSAVESSDVELPSKYVKRADLERARIAAAAAASSSSSTLLAKATPSPPPQSPKQPSSKQQVASREGSEPAKDGSPAPTTGETFNISNEEAVKRLRARGQPIRLFGETDKERRLRLRALQLMEERDGTKKGLNEFSRAMASVDEGLALREIEKAMGGPTDDSTATPKRERTKSATPVPASDSKQAATAATHEVHPKDAPVIVDLALVKTNPHKIYPQIYHALKRMLKEWEDTMNDRPEEVKRSTQGKIAAATQQTSAESLKPLFKKLRNRALEEEDVLSGIAEIVHYIQVREYVKANDAYLRLSIGNAAWPMGVGNVGIHERKAREKLFENKVGHALNDETSRKFLQSLKRLITFNAAAHPAESSSGAWV